MRLFHWRLWSIVYFVVPGILLACLFPCSRGDIFGTGTRNVQTNTLDSVDSGASCNSNEIATGFTGYHHDNKREDRIYYYSLKCTRVSEWMNECMHE